MNPKTVENYSSFIHRSYIAAMAIAEPAKKKNMYKNYFGMSLRISKAMEKKWNPVWVQKVKKKNENVGKFIQFYLFFHP